MGRKVRQELCFCFPSLRFDGGKASIPAYLPFPDFPSRFHIEVPSEGGLSTAPDFQGLDNHWPKRALASLFPTLSSPSTEGCMLCPQCGQKKGRVPTFQVQILLKPLLWGCGG